MAVSTPSGKRVTKQTLRKLHRQWKNGRSKADIERELGIVGQRGKWVTRAFEKDLSVSA